MFNKKKKYYTKKLEGVQNMIWDLEFSRHKKGIQREQIRREYDGAQSRLQIIETQIKTLPEDQSKWTGEQKRILDQKALLIRDIEGERNGDGSVARPGYKDIMKDMDLEMHGSGKTNEFPDGVNGINQQIEALRELQSYLRTYIKNI